MTFTITSDQPVLGALPKSTMKGFPNHRACWPFAILDAESRSAANLWHHMANHSNNETQQVEPRAAPHHSLSSRIKGTWGSRSEKRQTPHPIPDTQAASPTIEVAVLINMPMDPSSECGHNEEVDVSSVQTADSGSPPRPEIWNDVEIGLLKFQLEDVR